MFELSQMPILPGANQEGRAPQLVSVEKLNTVGVSNTAFALHEGDVIKFPEGNPLVVAQKIRNSTDSPVAYYVAVERNGKPSWLGIGILTRRDANGQPLGKFQAKMINKPSFKEIYEELAGKTIKGGSSVAHKFAVFAQDGTRTEETRERMIPTIECDGWSL